MTGRVKISGSTEFRKERTFFMRIEIIAVFLSFALITGCSTKHVRIQDLSIKTDPAGVRATIDDQSCITPCTLTNVDRTAEYVTFEQGAYKQQYALDKKYDGNAMITVEFIGLKIGMPALVITGAAYEIQPIDVKFSGTAENPLQTASPVGGTVELHAVATEVAAEPAPAIAQIFSQQEQLPFALAVGVSGPYGMKSLIKLEKMLTKGISAYLDAGYADYRSTQDDYRDAAHGLGGVAGMNIYWRSPGSLEGPYLGGGLGFWNLKGGWKDDTGSPFETTGRGTAHVFDINVHLGYKWLPAGYHGFFIDPSIAVDFMPTNCDPYPFGPAGASLTAGLAVGKQW